MNKAEMLRYVNLPLAFSLFLQGVTGLIILIEINLPIMKLIYEIHEYNGVLLLLLSAAHIFLNWSWIRVNFFPAPKRPVQSS